MKKSSLFLSLAVIFVGFGCCSQRSASFSKILDKTLTPIELNGTFVSENLAELPTLIFRKNGSKLGGFSGCNNYFGTYKFADNKLTISAIGATKKACIGVEGDTERALFKALRQANSIAFSGDTLLLKNGDETVAKFVIKKQAE